MQFTEFLIPPSLDAKQALRLRRFGLAVLTYVLATALMAITSLFGALAPSSALEVAAAVVAANLGLYFFIRSGFNLRFKDPSLTRLQMLLGTTFLMFVVYNLDEGRNIALFGCFLIFLFGVFRLDAREFTMVTLYTLAAYATVINLLMRWRPQAIHDVKIDLMSWLVLAGLLPGFTSIGGKISALRRRLRESEARYRSLTEMSSDYFWESDAEHRLTLLGAGGRSGGVPILRQAPRIGQRRWEIPYLSPDEAGWRAHRAVLDAHQPFRDFEISRVGADGAPRYLSLSGDPVFDQSGAFKGYHGIGSDITARKRAEQALRDSAEKLRVFTENVPAMIVSWDEDLHCRFANKIFVEFFGLVREDILGRHLREVIGEEAYRDVEPYFTQVREGKPVTYQRTHQSKDGETCYIEVKLLPQTSDHGKFIGCFAVTTDITEHKLAEERIQRVAHHDSLTGLPNRLLFNDRLQQTLSLAKRESRQFALLYLDLDKFKPVNDSMGHTAGDELLQAVAARVRHQVRASDTLARVGGDEFTVILPDIAARDEAAIVARKIIAALGVPFRLGPQSLSVEIGASIGIAVYPADGRDADTLVNAADAAMYQAKQAGNSFRFCVG